MTDIKFRAAETNARRVDKAQELKDQARDLEFFVRY